MASITLRSATVDFPVGKRQRAITAVASETGGRFLPDRGVIRALDGIELALKEGDRVGLIGHNGAGKSTLLRVLAGVYAPTSGSIDIRGRVSTLFQQLPGLQTEDTGRENIVTCGLHLGMSRVEIARKMDEVIAFTDLGPYIDMPVRIYSSGMKTRLGFAVATAIEPEILILDEGLATGDAAFAQKATERLNEFVSRASILVVASHSTSLLDRMCQEGLVLEHGRMVAYGPLSEVVQTYHKDVVEAARSGETGARRRLVVLAQQLHRDGAPIPLELQEETVQAQLVDEPDNPALLRRLCDLLTRQDKPIPPDLQHRTLVATLRHRPDNASAAKSLEQLSREHDLELPTDIVELLEANRENNPCA